MDRIVVEHHYHLSFQPLKKFLIYSLFIVTLSFIIYATINSNGLHFSQAAYGFGILK